jgi:hypothetical protein
VVVGSLSIALTWLVYVERRQCESKEIEKPVKSSNRDMRLDTVPCLQIIDLLYRDDFPIDEPTPWRQPVLVTSVIYSNIQ